MERGAAAVLLAAGSGSRLSAGLPKGWVPLAGVPMARWSSLCLSRIDRVKRLVIVVPGGLPAEQAVLVTRGLSTPSTVVAGGRRRRDSVRAGLQAAGELPYVIVHDAARPLVSVELAERVLDAAQTDGAAVPALPVPDTLVTTPGKTFGELLPRGEIQAVQTPQAFSRELLERAHAQAPAGWDAPDDGSMVRALGTSVALVQGERRNFKITWPGDLAHAEALMTAGGGENGPDEIRIGMGWDVHPLRPGRRFSLLGVTVSDEFGPVGHSDGDPLSHAIADALLGAAALGDIGTLFPDDDPRCAGISGTELLRETVDQLAARGFTPLQVDAVLITDQPKISPHRDSIRERLAGVLRLPVNAVSVKGKRTEGLGGLAGGAGVGCQAIVRVKRVTSAR